VEDGSVRVLITSSRMPFALGMVRMLAAEGHAVYAADERMPFALGMVRMLAAEGHAVYAADDHSLSPGSHSKYLAGHFVYPSPRRDTAGFLAELERIAREHEIDVIVPAFEETFYISTQIERLSRFTKVFASPFPVLARCTIRARSRDWSPGWGFRSRRRSWRPPRTSCGRPPAASEATSPAPPSRAAGSAA